VGDKVQLIDREIMNWHRIRNIINQDWINAVVGRLTILIRAVLIVCIFISLLGLITIVIKRGDFDMENDAFTFIDGVVYIIIIATFYSIVYGTIPGILLLIAIYLDNRFRRKVIIQPVRFEIQLLLINLVIVLFASLFMAIKYNMPKDL
jgi:hypothetical protein